MATTFEGADRGIRVERPPKTLRELTLEKMREAILNARFKPGERLVERDLCEQLGVSRTIVREVLRHLESEALVAILPNRGPIVAETTIEDARQIYSIRAALESMAAEACAGLADEEAVAAMTEALLAIEKAYEAKNPPAVLEGTKTFYDVMFHAAEQSLAWSIVSSLTSRINRLRSLTITDRERDKDGPREMREILDAIAAKDPATAARAARFHVEQAASIALRMIALHDRS